MALVTLEAMSFYAYHGCYAQEQLVGNRFRVELEFHYDSLRAQQSDSIHDAVNYLSVYECIKAQMSITSHILEHVAARIADQLLAEFAPIERLRIKVVKLHPPLGGQLGGVGVTLERSRTP